MSNTTFIKSNIKLIKNSSNITNSSSSAPALVDSTLPQEIQNLGVIEDIAYLNGVYYMAYVDIQNPDVCILKVYDPSRTTNKLYTFSEEHSDFPQCLKWTGYGEDDAFLFRTFVHGDDKIIGLTEEKDGSDNEINKIFVINSDKSYNLISLPSGHSQVSYETLSCLNGKIFCGVDFTDTFYYYDISTSEWVQAPSELNAKENAILINNKWYYLIGDNNTYDFVVKDGANEPSVILSSINKLEFHVLDGRVFCIIKYNSNLSGICELNTTNDTLQTIIQKPNEYDSNLTDMLITKIGNYLIIMNHTINIEEHTFTGTDFIVIDIDSSSHTTTNLSMMASDPNTKYISSAICSVSNNDAVVTTCEIDGSFNIVAMPCKNVTVSGSDPPSPESFVVNFNDIVNIKGKDDLLDVSGDVRVSIGINKTVKISELFNGVIALIRNNYFQTSSETVDPEDADAIQTLLNI